MTKKKKTLRAAVLASIFAMAFSATAWAANSITAFTNSELKDYANSNPFSYDAYEIASNAGTGGLMFDGGWYAPDNKFYYISSDNKLKYIDLSVPANTDYNGDGYVGGVSDKKKYIMDNLTVAEKNKLTEMALDHNACEDTVQKNEDVVSYSNYIKGTGNFLEDSGYNKRETTLTNQDKEILIKLFEDTYKFNADFIVNIKSLEEYARKEMGAYLDGKIDNINVKVEGTGENRKLYFIDGFGAKGDGIDVSNTTLNKEESEIDFADGKLSFLIKDTARNEVTGSADIGNYIQNNAGDAYYYEIDEDGNKIIVQNPITINQAINNTYEVAKKHNTVVAGDNNIIVDGTVTNDDGGTEYKISLGTNLTGLNTVNTKEVITEKVTLGVDNNKTAITYEQYNNNEYRIKYGNNYIANLSDGMKYGADSGDELKLKLNDKLNVNGDNNITTVATAATGNTPAQIQVKLNDDITVNSVTANTIKAGNVNVTHTLTSNVVDANTVNAGNVNVTHTLTSNVVDANTVNAGNVNVTHTLKSNVVDSNTVVAAVSVTTPKIYLGESGNEVTYKNDRITYVNGQGEQQVANLNDGYYYTGDITKQVNGENPYADLTGKTINVYGGAQDLVSTTNNIGVTTTQSETGIDMKIQLAKNVGGFESVSVPGKDGKDGVDGTTITNEGIVITGPKGDPGKDGKDGTVTIKHDQVDVGGNRIENVADGVNPTDAVNVRQLDKLGNRVDKVGAGAAALAALHPLDFDPDDKLSFSAGVGNYGGETASALGMFYRPTEKVMLSAAGTMGNGENMVNMGVTFALDRKNNVSNSRVAMAREIQDLREQVATLTALVTQLAGRNNPALMDAVMFPDVPENHWAYDYIEGLQKRGIVEGYPDGNFGGDRSMTRYEYAAMLYRALEKGFPVDSRLLDEFDAELGRIRIDRIKGLDDDGNKIERVRVNQYEDRDDYGSKLTTVNEAE